MAKKKNKKKAKKQAFISSIIRDGKVTKKEVKKAAKKGIALDRIRKAAKKSTKPGNVFSKAPTLASRFASAAAKGPGAARTSTPRTVTPSAPVIKPGAQTLIDRDIARRAAAQVAGINNTAPTPAAAPAPSAPSTTPAPPPVDPMLQALMDQNELLQQQLEAVPDFESIFAQQAELAAQQRADDLAQMQQQQALAMEEMAARQAEQERQRLLTAQTQQANMARAGLRPDFSIGGRARADLYGTSGFKRRRRIRPATIAQGIAPTAAVAAGATNGNLLNV